MFQKKRASVDFSDPEYRLLCDESKKQNTNNSALICKLIGTFLPLRKDLKKRIGQFCLDQYLTCLKEMTEMTSFESSEKALDAQQWKNIATYFGCNPGQDNYSPTMTHRVLKEGYVTFPSEWIELNDVEGNPEDCMYCGVVESRNSRKYNIPHFIFYCNTKYSKEYSAELKEKVYAACSKAYPRFTELKNMEMQVSSEDEKDPEKMKEWDQLPSFGLFHIVVKGDPLYWNSSRPNYEPPAGAMIIRSSEN